MSAVASLTTSLTIVYSTVYSDANQRKHQRSASLDFVRGIHRWPVNPPSQGPVPRKIFPFDDVIMVYNIAWPAAIWSCRNHLLNDNIIPNTNKGIHFEGYQLCPMCSIPRPGEIIVRNWFHVCHCFSDATTAASRPDGKFVGQYLHVTQWGRDKTADILQTTVWKAFSWLNKANLKDLIAATGLVILPKLDSSRRFFSLCGLEIWWMTSQNNRAPLQ